MLDHNKPANPVRVETPACDVVSVDLGHLKLVVKSVSEGDQQTSFCFHLVDAWTFLHHPLLLMQITTKKSTILLLYYYIVHLYKPSNNKIVSNVLYAYSNETGMFLRHV